MHKKNIIIISIFLSVLGCITKKNTTIGGTEYTSLPSEAAADTIVQKALAIGEYVYATGMTGGLLIGYKGKIIVNRGFGWANEEAKIPITTETVTNIGSVAKQFTATAILKLEEQGKLKTTDAITTYFENVPANKQGITIHQLLTHTAGFLRVVMERTEHPPREEYIKKVFDSKLTFIPGEKYNYSNTGYSLLAAIIEIASGVSYEQYLNEHLWKPAGMMKTGFVIPQWKETDFAYALRPYTGFQSPNFGWSNDGPSWAVRGPGDILSTLEDLFKWTLAIAGDKILTKESKQKLFTPHISVDDKGVMHYGYGWIIEKSPRNTRMISHQGTNGFHWINHSWYPDEEIVILNFTTELMNSISERVANAIPELFFAPLHPFPSSQLKMLPSELRNYAGTYEMEPGGKKFVLNVTVDELAAMAMNEVTASVFTNFPKTPDSVNLTNLASKIEHIMNRVVKEDFEPIKDELILDGTLEEEKSYWRKKFIEWKDFGGYKGAKLLGVVPRRNNLFAYVLLEFEETTNVVIFRQNAEKKFYIGTSNDLIPRYYRFIPQSKDEFLVYNYTLRASTKVLFQRDEKNKIIGLTISNNQGDFKAKKIG